MRLRIIIIAACSLAGLFWLAGVVLNRPSAPDPAAVVSAPPATEPAVRELSTAGVKVSSSPAAPAESARPAAPPVVLSWEKRRDELLTSSTPTAEKAEQLLALLPQLAGPEQEEAAKHLANLLGDDQFVTAGAYLTNAQAPATVQSILMADLFNRPERVKLPLCLAIVRAEDHPQAGQARSLLTLFLSEDYGTNWPAWEEAIRARLQANH